jgi:hypothetical protein
MDKVKLYVVSLSAATIGDAIGSEKGLLHWVHNAAIITSVDMDTVRSQAEVLAFDSWPPEEGWTHHSAAITEVTQSFISEVLALREQGLLSNDPAETHQFFQFEPPETATH